MASGEKPVTDDRLTDEILVALNNSLWSVHRMLVLLAEDGVEPITAADHGRVHEVKGNVERAIYRRAGEIADQHGDERDDPEWMGKHG